MIGLRSGVSLVGLGLSAVGVLSLGLCSSPPPATFDGTLKVAGFNVESGGADPNVIAERHLGPLSGVDIWGFSEVQNSSWLTQLEQGAEIGETGNFRSILGTTGGGDRLAIVYDSHLLQLISQEELTALSIGGRVRAALIAQLRIRATDTEFLFVVNHLYRSDEEARHEQAQMLNEWVKTQTLPIIAVGDYNFDYEVVGGDNGNRDPGFDLMTADAAFVWIRPDVIVATICSTRYNSVLDFIFVANDAVNWAVESSEILFAESEPAYCPDDDTTSDHRPVAATFRLPAASTPN
jgi:endonuclease/exonuclease/phosphatase family metal-dependent hydrolase